MYDAANLLKHFLPAFVTSCLGLACFYRRIDLNRACILLNLS